MFELHLNDEFKKTLDKLQKKNPVIALAVNRKIKEIITRDEKTINAYKNLKYNFKAYKRAHITNSIVMLFISILKIM